MNSQSKHYLTSDKEPTHNANNDNNSSPTKKRSILINPNNSPSMRHKLILTTTPTLDINAPQQDITLNQLNLTSTNFIITGRIHYKYELNDKVGKFIFCDTDGNSCNILCFGDNIKNHYHKLEEKDVITISKAMPREASIIYSLCNSSIDLSFTYNTTWKKVQGSDDSSYPITFTPSTIKEIKSGEIKKHDLFDCIANITTSPETRTVILKNTDQQNIATTIISDHEDTIQLTAWGNKMIALLHCCAKSKNAFAFTRLKRTLYNGNYTLYLFEGAEIYDHIGDSDIIETTIENQAAKQTNHTYNKDYNEATE